MTTTATRVLARHELRAAFARSLSAMYGREVPAYTTLVEVAGEVNADAFAHDPAAAQRLGSLDRVTAERHGAIRLGTPAEMRQVARVFAALGMYPVGAYDLRDASASSVPVVSTAFRPTEPEELARNPFRVFTSLLTVWDEQFFDADLRARLGEFLARREVFGPELLVLADRADAEDGLGEDDARRFLALATAAFELSPEPVDRAWYAELEAVSPVAADIGGVGSTHINHLTPRVLDIDDLYQRMTARGITMIDEIQGPPRWDGPDVLLRQTSFRALSEPRAFREPDGTVAAGSLRVRFGEVEARGIALTPAGRALYDDLLAEVDARLADCPPARVDAARRDAARPEAAGAVGTAPTQGGGDRAGVARAVWAERLPATEDGLADADLAFFTYALTDRGRAARGARAPLDTGTGPGTGTFTGEREPADDRVDPSDLAAAVAAGLVRRDPIVYEDFLPRSAAGIFRSNLAGGSAGSVGSVGSGGARGHSPGGAPGRPGGDATSPTHDRSGELTWMAEMLQRPVADPADLYAAQREASIAAVTAALGLGARGVAGFRPPTATSAPSRSKEKA